MPESGASGSVGAPSELIWGRYPAAIQLPDDEDIFGPQERQRLGQSGPIILGAGGVIFKRVPAVDPRRQQCITL
jgi:hypothetical protein